VPPVTTLRCTTVVGAVEDDPEAAAVVEPEAGIRHQVATNHGVVCFGEDMPSPGL
jgi:hypothetical protein